MGLSLSVKHDAMDAILRGIASQNPAFYAYSASIMVGLWVVRRMNHRASVEEYFAEPETVGPV